MIALIIFISLICFIAVASATVFIYRQGLKDGQKVSNGERIIDKPMFKNKEDKAIDEKNKKLSEAIQKRAEFGVKK